MQNHTYHAAITIFLGTYMLYYVMYFDNFVLPHLMSHRKVWNSIAQDCIGAIERIHMWAVLPLLKQIDFIGRKGVPTQNVLVTCDFNLCFTFVLSRSKGTTYDSHILAQAMRSLNIHFPQPTVGKYYLDLHIG